MLLQSRKRFMLVRGTSMALSDNERGSVRLSQETEPCQSLLDNKSPACYRSSDIAYTQCVLLTHDVSARTWNRHSS